MNTTDPIHDHMVSVTFENIADPIERVRFFRPNNSAIARESARRTAGTPLPAPPRIVAKVSEPMRGLFIKRNGQIMRCVPTGGIFGNAIRR